MGETLCEAGLVEKIGFGRNRDDDLYAATVNGWRNLPACTGDLSADQRWDIVNYFRTLAKNR